MAKWFLDDVMDGETLPPDRIGTVIRSEPELIEVALDSGRTFVMKGVGANVDEPTIIGARVAFRRIE